MCELATFQQEFLHQIDHATFAHPAMAVYRNTVAVGAITAVIDNFSTVAALVGPKAMKALAQEFVRDVPPDNPILARYGGAFPSWLAEHPLADELPYLADVARIDRMRTEAHLAADAPEFGLEDVARLTAEEWTRCRVTMRPATRIAWFAVPAPSIWVAHPVADGTEIAPEWQAEGILVTRSEGAVGAWVIGACEHRILHGLRLGETVGQAALAASRLYPGDNITRAFRKIVASGAFSSIKMKG
uniref:HvfC/BufC N-terminal domain-containing protein n=1 Tax=Altererythrobacter segetis TaxID=1104773 RepID=UPI0014092558|nr:DNA-binding domain-containing protein [Altererythrobacter segetis]